ncbi:MAG TPA: efflux RND transporter permease subunit [Caulobacteraceae bacterium]
MIAWLFDHRRSLLFLLAALAIAGAAWAFVMPVALFPQINFPRVVVSVEAGDRPVDRMVVEVTRPLEQALRQTPGVQHIRSTSTRGSADIALSFGWNENMAQAVLQTEAMVTRALPTLPAGVTYAAHRMDPTIFPVLGLSVTSPKGDLVALRDLAVQRLAPTISAIPGVAEVQVLGGRQSEFQVAVDAGRLAALGLSPDDVAKALAANNVIRAVGRIEDRYRLYLTLAVGQVRTVEDLAALPIKAGPSGVVTLGQVATVRLGEKPEFTRITADGRDAVLLNVRQQPAANTVALVKAVQAAMAQVRPTLPAGVTLTAFYDQSELITQSAASVRDAILIGALLAAVVLFGFLRQLWLTAVIAALLPLTLAAAILGLGALGQSFNIMTLGGMAAAVGLIVDDAVVMLEHIAKRFAASGTASIASAAQEVFKPLTGSSMATVVVFAPLAFLGGVTGGFFRALALTMAISLVVSYFAALLIVPVAARRLLTVKNAHELEHGGPRLAWLRDRYGDWLGKLGTRPWIAAVAVVALLVLGGLAASRVGSGFMPKMDEGGFILDYKAPPGTSLTETDRLLRLAEAEVRATPEVRSYSRRTGAQLGGGLTEADEGDMFIRLKTHRARNIEAIMADVRERIATRAPGLQVETAQLMEDLIGDLTATPQPIEMKVTGAPAAELQPSAGRVAKMAEATRGVVEVNNGLRVAGDAIQIKIDPIRTTLAGLDADAVASQVEAQVGGAAITNVQVAEKVIGVRVWDSGDLRSRISLLQGLPIKTAQGASVPLSSLAEIDISPGQSQVVREDLRDIVPVTGRLEGRDLGSAVGALKQGLRAVPLPPGVQVNFGGLYEEQQQSFRGLMVVLGAAVLLVSALLLYLYENIAIVISILAVAALSIVGVFLGLFVTGVELNISALMGMTMIVGIVTEIAIFYFAEIDPTVPPTTAGLVFAGRARLRPILMTTSIAILALTPLALGIGAGSAMQRPLAVAIISGLILAAPLVLFVMPTIYGFLGGAFRSRTSPRHA